MLIDENRQISIVLPVKNKERVELRMTVIAVMNTNES